LFIVSFTVCAIPTFVPYGLHVRFAPRSVAFLGFLRFSFTFRSFVWFTFACLRVVLRFTHFVRSPFTSRSMFDVSLVWFSPFTFVCGCHVCYCSGCAFAFAFIWLLPTTFCVHVYTARFHFALFYVCVRLRVCCFVVFTFSLLHVRVYAFFLGCYHVCVRCCSLRSTAFCVLVVTVCYAVYVLPTHTFGLLRLVFVPYAFFTVYRFVCCVYVLARCVLVGSCSRVTLVHFTPLTRFALLRSRLIPLRLPFRVYHRTLFAFSLRLALLRFLFVLRFVRFRSWLFVLPFGSTFWLPFGSRYLSPFVWLYLLVYYLLPVRTVCISGPFLRSCYRSLLFTFVYRVCVCVLDFMFCSPCSAVCCRVRLYLFHVYTVPLGLGCLVAFAVLLPFVCLVYVLFTFTFTVRSLRSRLLRVGYHGVRSLFAFAVLPSYVHFTVYVCCSCSVHGSSVHFVLRLPLLHVCYARLPGTFGYFVRLRLVVLRHRSAFTRCLRCSFILSFVLVLRLRLFTCVVRCVPAVRVCSFTRSVCLPLHSTFCCLFGYVVWFAFVVLFCCVLPLFTLPAFVTYVLFVWFTCAFFRSFGYAFGWFCCFTFSLHSFRVYYRTFLTFTFTFVRLRSPRTFGLFLFVYVACGTYFFTTLPFCLYHVCMRFVRFVRSRTAFGPGSVFRSSFVCVCVLFRLFYAFAFTPFRYAMRLVGCVRSLRLFRLPFAVISFTFLLDVTFTILVRLRCSSAFVLLVAFTFVGYAFRSTFGVPHVCLFGLFFVRYVHFTFRLLPFVCSHHPRSVGFVCYAHVVFLPFGSFTFVTITTLRGFTLRSHFRYWSVPAFRLFGWFVYFVYAFLHVGYRFRSFGLLFPLFVPRCRSCSYWFLSFVATPHRFR